MKKSLFNTIAVIAAGLLLVGCSAANPEHSQSSLATSGVPLSGDQSLPEEAKQLITANNENSPMPTYDEASKTYIFDVGEEKRSYTISGAFEGRFLVNDTTLSEYKGITFKLNNVSLTNNESGGNVFLYQPHSKAITIEALSGTNNTITSKGTAISSVNNVNLCGSGTLNIKSVSEHGVKGDDVRCYDTVAINIEGSGKDGLHGKRFYSDDGGDGAEKRNYSGTINMKAITKQAFDFCDEDDWSGSINLITSTTVNVNSCENVFKSDARIVLDGKVTATGVVDKAITKDKANASELLVLVSGEVSFNGTTLAPSSYSY